MKRVHGAAPALVLTLSLVVLLPALGLVAGCVPEPGVAPGSPEGPALSPGVVSSMAATLGRALARPLPPVQGDELYSPDFAAARLAAAQARAAPLLAAGDATPEQAAGGLTPQQAAVARQIEASLEAAGQALRSGNLAQALELAGRARALTASLEVQVSAGGQAAPGAQPAPGSQPAGATGPAVTAATSGDLNRRLEDTAAAWDHREAELQRLEARSLPLAGHPVLTVLEYLADTAQRQLDYCRAAAASWSSSPSAGAGPDGPNPAAAATLASGTESAAVALELFDHLRLRLEDLDRPGPSPPAAGLGRVLWEEAHQALVEALARARIEPTPPGPGADPVAALQAASLESERHLRTVEGLAGLAEDIRPGRTALAWLRALEARQEAWALDQARALEGTAGMALARLAADSRRDLAADLGQAQSLARGLERRGLDMSWARTRMKEGLELAAEGDRVLAETLAGTRPPELGARDAGLVYVRARVVERLVLDVLGAIQRRAGG